jgi:hypothetical protein
VFVYSACRGEGARLGAVSVGMLKRSGCEWTVCLFTVCVGGGGTAGWCECWDVETFWL